MINFTYRLGLFLYYCYNKIMLRKIACLFISITIASVALLPTLPSYAKPADRVSNQNPTPSGKSPDDSGESDDKSPTSTNAVFTGDCSRTFLGLLSWDCNVEVTNETTLKNGIVQIATNVATDITIIAAYLVLGYVIYGGYLYISSSGDPSKAATAKKTLTHAFIGLAIAMSSYTIMSTIRIALLGTSGKFDCDILKGGGSCADPTEVIKNTIEWAIGIAGLVAAVFVVYGGIAYITSAGDPSKLQKAKQTIIYALIGLAIVGLAEIITAFVSNTIRNANKSASIQTHQIICLKEANANKKNI